MESPKPTLADYISGRCKLGPGRSLGKNPVFSHEVEEEMVRYAQILANLYCGMAREEMQRLAFDLAQKNNLNHPFNREKRMAGSKDLCEDTAG